MPNAAIEKALDQYAKCVGDTNASNQLRSSIAGKMRHNQLKDLTAAEQLALVAIADDTQISKGVYTPFLERSDEDPRRIIIKHTENGGIAVVALQANSASPSAPGAPALSDGNSGKVLYTLTKKDLQQAQEVIAGCTKGAIQAGKGR